MFGYHIVAKSFFKAKNTVEHLLLRFSLGDWSVNNVVGPGLQNPKRKYFVGKRRLS